VDAGRRYDGGRAPPGYDDSTSDGSSWPGGHLTTGYASTSL
jgi:hypothetical protein